MSVQLVDSPRVLDDDVRAAKNKKIAASAKKTRERRKRQTPRVVDLKIITNKPVSYTHLTLPTTPYV